MGMILTDCPHCGAANQGMPTFGVTALSKEEAVAAFDSENVGIIGASCGACFKPICAAVRYDLQKGLVLSGGMQHLLAEWHSKNARLEARKLILLGIWPAKREPDIPKHLPSKPFEAKLLEAERAFIGGIFTGAAALYRSLLDVATKIQAEQAGVSESLKLAARIDALAIAHAIPNALKDWAHEIREFGNEGVHEDTVATKEDATTIRNFALTYLRYAFELPGDIAVWRNRKTDAG